MLLQDKVRAWRAGNAVRVVTEAQAQLEKYQPGEHSHAHPRLVATVVEEGSWADETVLQKMWGGLLASSCSPDGHDDSNLIFVGLLKQLTRVQIKILRYAVEQSEKAVDANGLIFVTNPLMTDISTVLGVAGVDDIHRVDQELDHLRGRGLIMVGFHFGNPQADLMPTALALNLYVRCQGYRGSAVDYFGLPSNGTKP